MYDLTVIVSGIRIDKWKNLIKEIYKGAGGLKVQIIFAGPQFPDELKNVSVTYVKTFASPSTAFAQGAALAKGKYLCQCPDDAIIFADSFKKCVEALESKPKKTAAIVRYSEGANYSGQEFPLAYWNVRYHWVHFNKCQAIKPEWDAGPWFMTNYEYYRELGGINCKFEALNLNVYDMMYRIWRDGGEIIMSPVEIASLDWIPDQIPSEHPCSAAFLYHDLPLLGQMYSSDEVMNSHPIRIDIDNWKQSPEIWARKHNK